MNRLGVVALGLAIVAAGARCVFADAHQELVVHDFISRGHSWEALKAKCGRIREVKREAGTFGMDKVVFHTFACSGLKFVNTGNALSSIEISKSGYALPGNLKIGSSTTDDVRAFLGREDSDTEAISNNGKEAEKFPDSLYYHTNGNEGVDTVRFDFDKNQRIKRVTWGYYVE